jgi:hypothetical protein
MRKRPPREGWQEDATTDPNIIQSWYLENPRFNYGIMTGLANELAVIDVDGTEAQAWWNSKNLASGSIVTTPSGPDRTHRYFRVTGVEIQTNQSKIAPGVDIRAEGGYVVGPGSMLPTGTYRGDLRAVPMISDELLELLPEKQEYESVEWTGEQVDSASDDEDRQVNAIIKALNELPVEWHEGAGWHGVVYRSACWLWRMVNSGAYALTEDAAFSIMMENTPTYGAEWDQDKVLDQWRSARSSTAGQFATPPRINVDFKLPSVLEIQMRLGNPNFTVSGDSWQDLIFSEPDWRRVVAEGLQELALSQEDVAALALATKQASLEEIFAEIARVTEDQVDPTPDHSVRRELLTEEERERVAKVEWFGADYLKWVRTRMPIFNGPYHRINRWMILSLVFSMVAYIPDPEGRVLLNIYIMVLGGTTTGKTKAHNLMRQVIKMCFPLDDTPDLGGDFTPESLVETLTRRDGKPSLFRRDEADGWFEKAAAGGYSTGMVPAVTALYDGEVPKVYRQGNKDMSGMDAESFFSMYLMGTVVKLTGVLETKLWESGFLARYVWTVGEPAVKDKNAHRVRLLRGDQVARAYDAMPTQWAAQFEAIKAHKLRWAAGDPQIAMDMTPEAEDRLSEFNETIMGIAHGHRFETIMTASLDRFRMNIMKCAMLVALSRGNIVAGLDDVLVAIEQAEEWLEAMLMMLDATTASVFSRAVDDVERFIAAQHGRQVRVDKIYAHFKIEKKTTDERLTQLFAEGRAIKFENTDNSITYRLKDAA